MAEEEEKPEPNIVCESSTKIVAPLNLVWKLLKDSLERPKQYHVGLVGSKSLGRDRETRAVQGRLLQFQDPKMLVSHGIEVSEPVECDKPLPPPPEPVEGEEEAAAEEPPAAEEGAEGEEGEAAPAEPPAPERWVKGCVSWTVTMLGDAADNLAPCEGTVTFQLTCVPEDTVSCELGITVSVYSETMGELSLAPWVAAEVASWKSLCEKMIYLCPAVVNRYTQPLKESILTKAKSFSFLPMKLQKSPSAAKLIEKQEMTGSVGFYLKNTGLSPTPLPRTTASLRALLPA